MCQLLMMSGKGIRHGFQRLLVLHVDLGEKDPKLPRQLVEEQLVKQVVVF
jgi:hypothetical protein